MIYLMFWHFIWYSLWQFIWQSILRFFWQSNIWSQFYLTLGLAFYGFRVRAQRGEDEKERRRWSNLSYNLETTWQVVNGTYLNWLFPQDLAYSIFIHAQHNA
jgi:hypothetical protein